MMASGSRAASAAPVIAARPKQLIWQSLRLAFGLTLLYAIYRRGLLDVGAARYPALDLRFYITGVVASLLVIAAIVLLSIRFRLVLARQGVDLTLGQCLSLTAIGALSGSVLPGLVSGDAVKAAYLVRGRRGKVNGVIAVIIDRAIGTIGLVALGSVSSLIVWAGGYLDTRLNPLLLVAPACVVGAAVGVWFLRTGIHAADGSARRVIRWLPVRLQTMLISLAQCAESVSSPRLLALSMASHGLIVLEHYMMAVLINDPLTIWHHFALNPIAMVLNIVPLTPGGLGITEGAFAYLFQQAGSGNGALVGLLGRAIQYVVFVVAGGAAIIALERRAPAAPRSEAALME